MLLSDTFTNTIAVVASSLLRVFPPLCEPKLFLLFVFEEDNGEEVVDVIGGVVIVVVDTFSFFSLTQGIFSSQQTCESLSLLLLLL